MATINRNKTIDTSMLNVINNRTATYNRNKIAERRRKIRFAISILKILAVPTTIAVGYFTMKLACYMLVWLGGMM